MKGMRLARAALLCAAIVGVAITCGADGQETQTARVDDIRIISSPEVHGYIDPSGKLLTPSVKPVAHFCRYREGLAAAMLDTPEAASWGQQEWGFLDKSGNWAIEPKFQYAEDFSEGLAAVNVGGRPYGGMDLISYPRSIDDLGRHCEYPVYGGKWGFIDKQGKVVISATYDQVQSFSEGLAYVSRKDPDANDPFGRAPREEGAVSAPISAFVDATGRLAIVLPKDAEAKSFSEGLAAYQVNERYGFIDKQGKIVIAPRFTWASSFSCGRALVRTSDWSDNAKYGYIDRSGKLVIKPQFRRADDFSEGLAAVHVDGKAGFIDPEAKLVIPPQFDGAHGFRDGLAPVRVGQKWGYVDKTGTMAIAPQWVGASWFRDGVARVAVAGDTPLSRKEFVAEGTWGFIDKKGHFVLPAEFDLAMDFSEGLAFVERYPKLGLKHADGRVILAPCYREIEGVNRPLARVRKNYREGFIDTRTGKVAIPLEYSQVKLFHEDRAAVCQDGKWGVIDTAGAWIARPEYEEMGDYAQGLVAVDVKVVSIRDSGPGKWGYLDRDGKMAIAPQWAEASEFSDGRASVRVDRGEARVAKWGFIDRTGKMVIPADFAAVDPFCRGIAAVKVLTEEEEEEAAGSRYVPWEIGRWGLIDTAGKFVVEPRFACISGFSEGLAPVQEAVRPGQPGKWGFLDRTGKMAIAAEFADARQFHEGLAPVQLVAEDERPGRWGFIDKSGKMVIPATFSGARLFFEGLAAVRVGSDEEEPPIAASDPFDPTQSEQAEEPPKEEPKWGFIDKTGAFVIEPRFDWARAFRRGQARVSIGEKYYLVDRKGQLQEIPHEMWW